MNDRAPPPDSLRNVLLLQGGGALGAYQVGVIEALLAGDRVPAWVVGTSIGAINAALIAGNPPHLRLERLQTFWRTVAQGMPRGDDPVAASVIGSWQALRTIALGVRGFFVPRLGSPFSLGLRSDVAKASYYDVAPLRRTLGKLIDFDFLAHSPIRLSVGAVDVESGAIRYFDSAHERITVDHILASGALPPAFPAVEVDGRRYWDGGIYSNTPLEYVLQDSPRVSSLCFLATLWPVEGKTPDNVADALERSKDIQFASRAHTLLAMEQETQQLRHAISLLAERVPDDALTPELKDLAALGCRSMFHVVRLQAPRLPGEDQFKDIEFVAERIHKRRSAGYADTRAALAAQAWRQPTGADEGLCVHAAGHAGSAAS